jgi:hypothetical protein
MQQQRPAPAQVEAAGLPGHPSQAIDEQHIEERQHSWSIVPCLQDGHTGLLLYLILLSMHV